MWLTLVSTFWTMLLLNLTMQLNKIKFQGWGTDFFLCMNYSSLILLPTPSYRNSWTLQHKLFKFLCHQICFRYINSGHLNILQQSQHTSITEIDGKFHSNIPTSVSLKSNIESSSRANYSPVNSQAMTLFYYREC